MRVSDLTSGAAVVLRADDTLHDAVRELEDNSLTALAVEEAGRLVGILTASDIIRAAADAARFDGTRLADYMTPDPVTVAAGEDADVALRVMIEGGVDHLPVLDEDGEVTAILAVRDLVTLVQGSDRARRRS